MQVLEFDGVAGDGFGGYGGGPGAVWFSHGEAGGTSVMMVTERVCFWVEMEAVAAGEEGYAG